MFNLLLAFTVFITSFLSFFHSQPITKPNNTPVTPTPQTSNWKTFTDKSKLFTLEYPSSWENPSEQLQSTHIAYVFPADMVITVGFRYDQSKGRPLTYLEELALAKKYAESEKPIVIDGIQTQEYIGKVVHGGIQDIDILLTHNSGIVTISANSILEGEGVLPHILSTFKFLNGENERKATCKASNGSWLENYNECEGVALKSGYKNECTRLGGKYQACDSACRHNANPNVCDAVCMQVCKY